MTNWKSEVAAAVVANPVAAQPLNGDAALAFALEQALAMEEIAPRDISFAQSLLRGFDQYRSFTGKQRPFVQRLLGAKDAASAPQASPDATLAAALRAALPYVGSSLGFAQSLLQGFDKYGSFSDRQRPYAQSLANSFPSSLLEAPETAQVSRSAEPGTPVQAIPVIAQQAQPAVVCRRICSVVSLDGFSRFTVGEVQLSLKNDGSLIWVKYAGLIAGSIDTFTGVYRESRKYLSADALARGKTALLAIEADPKAAASQNGILTGRCSCCGRALTDPTSIEIGIGPICLGKFG